MKTPQPYDWFGPKACRTLYDQMTAIGPDHCRLELYRNKDGAMMAQLRRMDQEGRLSETTDSSDPPPVNDSFICPPICG